ncbi:PadR family transcriptional regulator [Streptomyces sp. 4N509B]|uniref:PadR family transcriptional regulator n=1 Tax=Streptomyces sp. 4N509B TaxID=3457413 RepID=UPI003FD0C791
MPPVFGHGRLRLYLLKLLGESPRHGYEVIRLLRERFEGMYAPSAGTVYPRLAKLEAEGLVKHAERGGRKVYSLTTDGEAELHAREEELTALEREIRDSLAALAAEIREDVSGSASALRQEVRRAAAEARAEARSERAAGGRRAAGFRAGERAGTEGGGATRQDREERAATREQFEQAARRIQERVQSRASVGDWSGAVREGLQGLGHEFGGLGPFADRPTSPWHVWAPPPEEEAESPGGTPRPGTDTGTGTDTEEEAGAAAGPRPGQESVPDPERELLRLLDGLRDDVRDAARDHGVSQEQFREARRTLSETAAHLVALLRSRRED